MSHRRLITVFALTLACIASTTVSAAAAPQVNFYSAVDQFMCVSCHEPLNQVNSPQALSEKQTLRGLIKQGLTMSQIKRGMVAQYGQQVLAQPSASGVSLTIYILPPAVLVGGLVLLAFTLPKWRERSRRAAATRLEAASPLSSADASRLDDELANFI